MTLAVREHPRPEQKMYLDPAQVLVDPQSA
jgi:hypothetical protein